jgi:hypothetical protein
MKVKTILAAAILAITASSCTTNTSGNATGPLSDSTTNDFVKPDSSANHDNQSMSNPEMNNYGDTVLKK